MSLIIKPPLFIRRLYPSLTWRFAEKKKNIYLTFDDGPTPEVTTWVLSQLKKHQAKATFFCIGKNVEKYPDIINQIKLEGHTIGNHSYNHVNGWKTKRKDYVENFKKAQNLTSQNIIRPPYGKITRSQIKAFRRTHQIIMWDVLSKDYDKKTTKEKCLNNVLNNIQAGSIVVFHDSLKAKDKLYYSLPKILDAFSNKGYVFAAV